MHNDGQPPAPGEFELGLERPPLHAPRRPLVVVIQADFADGDAPVVGGEALNLGEDGGIGRGRAVAVDSDGREHRVELVREV